MNNALIKRTKLAEKAAQRMSSRHLDLSMLSMQELEFLESFSPLSPQPITRDFDQLPHDERAYLEEIFSKIVSPKSK